MNRRWEEDDEPEEWIEDGEEDGPENNWGEEVFDEELDHDGWDDDDDYLTVPCPACGAEVIADVGKCPACGEYLPEMAEAWRGKPWWWIVLGLAGIGAVIYLSSGAAWMM